jgi:phage-related protein
VDAELDALPKGLRAKSLHIAEMLEELGPFQVREPYVKSLGGKLFEIRMKSEEGIARAIYNARERTTPCRSPCVREEDC